MVKVELKEVNKTPVSFEVYNNINRLPLSIKLSDKLMVPNTMKYDILEGRNFIEFRFDIDYGDLYNISVVSIDSNAVKVKNNQTIKAVNDKLYKIYYLGNIREVTKRVNDPISIIRTLDSICFIFGKKDEIFYYKLSSSMSVGIDKENNLKSFFINGLTTNEIVDIFGS